MLLEKLLSLGEENVTNEELKLVHRIMTKKKLSQEVMMSDERRVRVR